MQLFKRECNRHPLKPKYTEYREWVDATATVLHPAEVIVPKEEISLDGLNDRQKKAIDYIKGNGKIAKGKYMQIYKISHKTAYEELKSMVNKNIIIRRGKVRATIYVFKCRK